MDEVDGAVGDPGAIGPTPDGASNATESPDPAGAPRRAVGRPRTPPPRARIELFLVDGPEGRQLRQLHADAMRTVLRWFADNQPADPTS